MEESMLWAVALWSGAFGLLLLVVGGVAAVYLNARAHKPQDPPPTGSPQSHTGDIAAADKTQPPVQSADAQRAAPKSPLAWAKAWVYAFLHAGIVSVVLGGITFFEDLAQASEEIQQTGTVTFPSKLLPGTLSGAMSPRLLSNPQQREGTGDSGEGKGHERPGLAPTDGASEWEVVS